jgi:hypothetical protein
VRRAHHARTIDPRMRAASHLAFAALAACTAGTPTQPASLPAPTGTVIARVGGVALTAAVLRARIDAQGGARERYKDPKELRAFVDNQVRFELLANEALRRGLDRDPDVQDANKRMMVQKLIEQRLENPAAIDDAAVQREYERTIGDYRQPERVQAAIIKLKSVAEANVVWRALAGGKSDARAFAELSKKHTGAEPNRDLELKYWSEDELVAAYGAELATAIFAVQHMGEVGPVVKGEGGFYVFRLTGRRAAFNRSLADVAPGIRQKLARQNRNDAFEAYVDELRGGTPVTIDDAALEHVWDAP